MSNGKLEFRLSFPPIISNNATVLILGSMPGRDSLRQQQYYAHQRNTFWYIMEHVCGASRDMSYEQRIQRLQQSKIALWDVLQHCEREGSLDSHINEASEIPNDFPGLFRDYPNICCILFNGKKAAKVFQRHVRFNLSTEICERLSFNTLPSTSPAYAALSKDEKLDQWRQIIESCFVKTK